MSRSIWKTSLFAILLCVFGMQLAWAQPGTITIVKVAQPSSVQSFAFYAFGPNSGCCMPFQLSGQNTSPTNTKNWTLAPGNYSFKEDFNNPVPVTGWNLVSISCLPASSNVVVDLPNKAFTAHLGTGAHITCTFTDKKATGTVTVKKVLVPATDPGKFTLQLTPNPGTLLANFLNAGNGAVMGPVTVPAGNYIVSEVGGSNGTSMANYTSVISGAGCGSNGAVTVAAGDNKVCTITNTRHPAICTGWPLLANVSIYSPGIPFGPQSVDICSGGKVTFHNVNSGQPWTIQYFSGPATFPPVPLATSPSVGTSAPFTVTGAYQYKINGTPAFVLHGNIIVH